MKKIVIVGGGFFGLYLAESLSMMGHDVTVLEKEDRFMSRASYANQARVHNGYHYPRSILTALRSRVSFPRFVAEFGECVDSEFEKYYMVANPLGKVTGAQFKRFCERIGAPCEVAPAGIQKLVNPSLVEAVFSTVEYAFDAIKLRDMMLGRLGGLNVRLRTNTSAEWVKSTAAGLEVGLSGPDGDEVLCADHVFNCTYSRINYLLNHSGVELVPLKHEMTEMCLVEPPPEFRNVGITVMCGPFFSAMPFPSAGLHSFSHVRYTPHYEWRDGDGGAYQDAHRRYCDDPRHSAWRHMQKDAARYIPLLSECRYERSIWEVKTILPRSDADDSRPILFRPNHGLPGLHCVMGGKIDNVYDAVEAISRQLQLN